MSLTRTILVTGILAALLFPLACQEQGGREPYTELEFHLVSMGSVVIGWCKPGGTIDVHGGARVGLNLFASIPGPRPGPERRLTRPVTWYSVEPPARGITIIESNPRRGIAILNIAPLGNQQRSRTDVIRYEISDPENQIPDRLERGTVRINVVPPRSRTSNAMSRS